MDTEEGYMIIIKAARKALSNSIFDSLAEQELVLFSNRKLKE
jgi:hypothetical protein